MRRTFYFNLPTLLLCILIQTVFFWVWISTHVQAAAPPPITQSGLNTQVSQPIPLQNGGAQYNITGGTRPGGAAGTNLFHSFGDFNVPTNNIANFLNSGSVNPATGLTLPSGLQTNNILARVTAGNPSVIFGLIQTNGANGFPTANLFLINPAGFLFGANATVNVGGMVAFTTADYLRHEGTDGSGIFYADPARPSVLTSSPVAAYGFLGSNPAAIAVKGSALAVAPAQSISLIGGNRGFTYTDPDTGNQAATSVQGGVTITGGKLSAPGGQINLVSVASPGEILTGTLAQAPNINGQSFGNLGAVQISQQSVIDVSGAGGGTVLIRGGQFLLDNSTISANVTGPGPNVNESESIGQGIDIQVSHDAVVQNSEVLQTNIVGNVSPGVTYGGVHIKADEIDIIGTPPLPPLFPFSGIQSNVGTSAQPTITGGNSGNITLEANSITIKGGGTIETRVFGSNPFTPAPGKAGNITLTANQDIQLNDSNIASSLLFGSGNAGNITITSRHGNILETGNAIPPDFIFQPGQPLPSFTFNEIFNQSTGGPGNTGNITLNAPEGQISLAGAVINLGIPDGTGIAGVFQANAKSMQLINFSTIQMDNFSPQPAQSFNIDVGGTLTLNSSRIITTARGPAQAADLNITAHDVVITGTSSLSTETQSAGNAGHLTISTETLQVTNGGRISSGTAQAPAPPPFLGLPPPPIPSGKGGTITVQGFAGEGSSASSVLIDGSSSVILTNTVGTGAAGNTNIAAQSLTVQNGGTISAATSGTVPSATGGTININANQVQVNSGGLITAATTSAGPGGSVNINAGNTFTSDAGSVTSTTTQTGSGGNINIAAGNSVTLSNGASVSASSTGQGSAGDIHINAGNFTATNSSVTTEALHSSGGIIKITTGAGGTVQLTDSTISASVLDGSGGGGSVNIDPQFVILENSQIIANSVFGPGGNINITTNLLLPDTASVISASSQFGQQGNIFIQSPISPASGKIVPLSQRPLIATTLLSQRCAALAGGSVSSFTVAGRDSLPAEPGGWVSSPLALIVPAVGEGLQASGDNGTDQRIEPPVVSVRRIAPAGFLTQSFAGSTDCAS